MKHVGVLFFSLLIGIPGIQSENVGAESVRGRIYAVHYSSYGDSCDQFKRDNTFQSSKVGRGYWTEKIYLVISTWTFEVDSGGRAQGFSLVGGFIFGFYADPYSGDQLIVGTQVPSCSAQ
jgi:hypothetical protein